MRVVTTDHVFDQETSTRELFDQVALKLVRSVVDGFNGECMWWWSVGRCVECECPRPRCQH